MTAQINFSSIEEQNFQGSIIEISPVADTQSSIFPVKLDLKGSDSLIKPGMVAEVTFTFGSKEDVNADLLIVPVMSVGEDGQGHFVFLIEPQENSVGIARKQQIELGELTNEGFIVKSGLTEGQFIATAGLQTLLEGQKVSLQN